MNNLVIYCKSYSVDVYRTRRLAESIQRFNTDKLGFYVSCPGKELALFKEILDGFDVNILADEDIVRSNNSYSLDEYEKVPGRISQQIVKSEFWRLGISDSYLCLDSDCFFIRPFSTSDFIFAENVPYTIVDECREILIPALAAKKQRVIDNYISESASIQRRLGRTGKSYNFGPNCPVWSRSVWSSLDENYIKPTKSSILQLIVDDPIEMRWYGEALLKFRAIPLMPSQPFFKMYAYAWQLAMDRKLGIRERDLSQIYCGVTYQSAWERELDWPSEGGNLLSRLGRKARKKLGRI